MNSLRRCALWGLCVLVALSTAGSARPARPTGAQPRTAPAVGAPERGAASKGDTSAADVRAQAKARMSPQQQQNVAKLQQDLAALKSGSEVTQGQKDALTTSLTNLAQGTVKPSQESVSKLSSDLSNAMADGDISKAEQIQLSQDVAVVMNSANVPMAEVQAVIADVESILISSNVDRSDVQTISADLRAIATELQTKAP